MSKPLPRSDALHRFCREFDAEAERSPKKFHRLKTMPLEFWTDSDNKYDESVGYEQRYESLDAIAIHIPTHRIDDFLETLTEQKYRELSVREQVPAVKKAYEHYKLLLKMCGVDDAGY